jgi:hypothetical protein
MLLAQDFRNFDPLKVGGGQDITAGSIASEKLTTFQRPAGIISEALKYLFPAAGLILFVIIVLGGFEILAGSASSKSKDSGKQRISAGIAGFILLFASYWIIQLVEIIFRVNIF